MTTEVIQNTFHEYHVKCPHCSYERKYSPKKPDTIIKVAKFTCPKCHKKNPVLTNVVISKAQTTASKKRLQKVAEAKRKQKEAQTKVDNILKLKWLELSPEKLVIKFRDFVGYVNKKGEVIEGQAFPPPIDEKGQYLGILKHELDAFIIIWIYIQTGILIKWPRGFGKTFVATWFMQFTMYYFGWPWMYLSVTEVLSDVAFWTYQWAARNRLIISTIKGGRQNTYKGFELSTGAKMRIFNFMGEEMVGQHGYYLMLDDISKRKWHDKPSENLKARRQWNHSVNYIRRKGLCIVGTGKYEGDILEYIEAAIPDIYIEVKTPYVMKGTFPDWEPIRDKNGREILWVPELYEYEELEVKKMTATEDGTDPLIAWMAEMMQDTRPLVGGSWQEEDLVYIMRYDSWDYEAAVISVDPAFTISNYSDQTGITVILMHNELDEFKNRNFLCIRAVGIKVKVQDWEEVWHNRVNMDHSYVFYKKGEKWVRHNGMLTIIEEFFQFVKLQIPGLRTIVVAIETNSGGDVIVQQLEYESDKYEFAGHVAEVKHTNMDKRDRIDKELFSPIKLGNMKFLQILKGSDLEYQILMFPNANKIDILDSLGMGKDELNKLKRISSANERRRSMLEDAERRRTQKAKDDWDSNYGIKGLRERGRSGTGRRKRSMF